MVGCNNCNWQGETFVDCIEGPKLACPRCGFIRRDRNFINYLRDTFPEERYLTSNCLEVSAGNSSELLHVKFPQTITINIRPSEKEIYGNLEHLVYGNNMFDLIICTDVMEHIEDDKQALREMFRVLKSWGRLIIHTPLWNEKGPTSTPKEVNCPEYHMVDRVFRYYTCESLAELMEKTGFRVKEIRFFAQGFMLHQDIFYECQKENSITNYFREKKIKINHYFKPVNLLNPAYLLGRLRTIESAFDFKKRIINLFILILKILTGKYKYPLK